MHTDPRVTHEFVSAVAAQAGIQIEVEATAGICRRIGAVLDPAAAAPAGSVAIDGIRCPAGGLIEAFGLTLTESVTTAATTACVVALKVVDKEGGSTTTVATITVPRSTTDVNTANGRATDGVPTATQLITAGARLLSSDTDLPYKVPQGGIVYVEVTTAASGGTPSGAFRPFVVVRQDGQPNPGAKATSPVLSIAS